MQTTKHQTLNTTQSSLDDEIKKERNASKLEYFKSTIPRQTKQISSLKSKVNSTVFVLQNKMTQRTSL